MKEKRKLICEYCGRVVREIDADYIREYPIAAEEWMEELLTEHYTYECPANLPEDFAAGLGNGILE